MFITGSFGLDPCWHKRAERALVAVVQEADALGDISRPSFSRYPH